MKALEWKKRQQWTGQVRSAGITIDIVITRFEGDSTYGWWLDAFDRTRMVSFEEHSGEPARSLVEAKRRAAQQVDTFIARLIHNRGGA